MYVKIELADERYCDGCAVKVEGRSWCAAFRQDIQWDWPPGAGPGLRWLRPQACIDASEEIEELVREGSVGPAW